MKNILILGAGKSSTVLIKYLSNLSEKFNLKIKVAALDVSYFFNNPLNNVLPIELNINNLDELKKKHNRFFFSCKYAPKFYAL